MLPAIALLGACFLLPVVHLLWRSVSNEPDPGLTARHYARLLSNGYYLSSLWTTLRLSLEVTGICLLIGYPLAYVATRVVRRKAIKRLIYAIVVAPLFTSAIVRAFGWMVLLGREGLVNHALIRLRVVDAPLQLLYGEIGVVIGSVYVLAPFMVLSIAAVLQTIDPSLEEAAADLGAGPMRSFWTVIVPMSLPGAIAGSTIVFTLSMSAYVTPSVLGGGRVLVISMHVFEQFMTAFDWPFGSALAVLLLVTTLAILQAASCRSRRVTL